MPDLYVIDPTTGMPISNTTSLEISPYENLPQETVTTTQVPIEPKPIGTSNIKEPDLVVTTPINTTTTTTASTPTSTITPIVIPNLGGFMGSLGGGGASGSGGSDAVVVEKKKPFPYWLLIVALVGGYLILKKKK